MKITKLKSTKRGDRVNVFINDKFKLSVFENLIADFGLFVGKKISKKDVEKIGKKDFKQRYYSRVLNLISRRPRSEFEIKQYLNKKLSGKKEKSEGPINEILKSLKKQNYLNDKNFADWWIRSRIEFRPRGRYLLKQELLKKGIKKQIIESALEKSGLNKKKEYELAMKLGLKRKRLLRSLKDKRNINKLISFLMRKGFGYETVSKVVCKLKKDGRGDIENKF